MSLAEQGASQREERPDVGAIDGRPDEGQGVQTAQLGQENHLVQPELHASFGPLGASR